MVALRCKKSAWELPEHLLPSLGHVDCFLLRLARLALLCCAPPYRPLCPGIELVDDERTFLVCIDGGRGRSEPPAPSPAAAESVIEGVQRLLRLCSQVRGDAKIGVIGDELIAPGCE